jgi:hypothetical protein
MQLVPLYATWNLDFMEDSDKGAVGLHKLNSVGPWA